MTTNELPFDRESYILNMFHPEDSVYEKAERLKALRLAESEGFSTCEEYSAHLRQFVLKAIEERNIEWRSMNVSLFGEVHTIRYPYELALRYALIKTNSVGLTQHWDTVSPKGLKMAADSSLHTDLWLSIGFDINGAEYFSHDKSCMLFYEFIAKLQRKVAGFEITIINGANLNKFRGKVVTPESKNITKKDILVIPTAGPEFDVIARKAGLVICSVGSRMAHLAVVGREFGLPLVRIDNAHTQFLHDMEIEVDFDKGSVTVFPSINY